MYKTCIYCHRDLGANEVVETFPVGRRLAFDSAKGRLWVICTKCRRWNLTPFEQRWETIEECERQFCDTPTTFSTDNIGLSQLPEGLELIRVGKPQRQEFAAWRYARRLALRHTVAAVAGAGFGAFLWGTAFTGLPWLIVPLLAGWQLLVVARIPVGDGTVAMVRHRDLRFVQLERSGHANEFALILRHSQEHVPWWKFMTRRKPAKRTLALYGSEAIHVAGLLLPRINPRGGSKQEVRDAVEHIEAAGSPRRLFAVTPDGLPKRTRIASMPSRLRLALEMAAHDESERRAMEGELAELEAVWREAEEIAAIADRLLIPWSVEEWIRNHRRS